ncbi:zinc finger protein 576, tandem duplicate 1 [Tautogolabrus adspersus]
MQSPTQANSGQNPVATATAELQLDIHTEAQPAQSRTDAQEEEKRSTAPYGAKTPVPPQENRSDVQTAEKSAGVAPAKAEQNEPAVHPLTEPSENTERMETEPATKPSAPTEPVSDGNKTLESDGQRSKKKDQGVRDGRKYVPSKKAMIDPLKMDMSKPLLNPLTSSQLSLQCLECHIIFSDHKSKERHLKLSHPAEYEQSILRNALFACYVCDRHFTNSTELMVHQKAHVERKPFKCPICGEAFNKSSELTIHKKIHFGQGGYACTDCGKACKTMTLLKYHRRTHTGERPYICKECGRRFNMSKALQKHVLSHMQDGAEGDVGDKALLEKDNGIPKKYPCSVCNATFKSTKTQLHHMKTKHTLLSAAASKGLPAGHQVKPSTPIITPISISQPVLLQLEANGPLQKVDANIDTEQIRRLIESLGNVQRVNQVVILGQVPPHAPPMEVHQISQPSETMNLNFNPPQIDFMGLKNSQCGTVELDSLNNTCDPMEQTIILEPITPDGQLENPSFSEVGSHIAAVDESIQLTLVQTEERERPEGDGMHQLLQQPDISAIQCDHLDQMVCQNEQDLEQTVILELTPALIPTEELEQSQTVRLNEISSSTLVTTTELEETPHQAPDQMVVDEADPSLSVPSHTVELELTPLQNGYQDIVLADTLTQTPNESETNPKAEVDTQMQTVSEDLILPVLDKVLPRGTQETTDQKPSQQDRSEQEPSKQDQSEQERSKNLMVKSKVGEEKVENLSEMGTPSATEEDRPQSVAKKVSQISEFPVNIMSAQELVKVRKRKSARAFLFQGYMQDLTGSLYNDDLQIDAAPAKRQRRKKSHLVVKFVPQSKEKKNKKQKKQTQQHQTSQEEVLRSKSPTVHLSQKKVSSQKKVRKGKKGKIGGHLVSAGEIKSPSSIKDPQVQPNKEDTRKKKRKKEVATKHVNNTGDQNTVASTVSKKKQVKMMQRDQPKIAKGGKGKRNVTGKETDKTKTSPASADITDPLIMEDSLLLLKGHKQPQLKVYKLDPSKASSNTKEELPNESQKKSSQSKNNKLKHPASDSTNYPISEGKKKGGRVKKNQKALSLLSSLKVSREPLETVPNKSKTTRKRKASPRVETEGVITSSRTKPALECKDCGERFSEVSSLQKHKTMVHVIESPGLTYTNGNIFEGVSRLDLYQLPKQHIKALGLMNAATGWDTEPETGEIALEDRERNVSFPSLIPSPSLPVPPSDVEIRAYEHKDESKIEPDIQSPYNQIINSDIHPNIPPESYLNASTLAQSSETGKPLASDEAKREEVTPKNPSLGSEGHEITDEGGTNPGFKEDNATTSAMSLISMPCTSEETPNEQVVFESESVTTRIEEIMNEKEITEGEECSRDSSPGIILEKVVTATPKGTADNEPYLMTARNSHRKGLDRLAENEVQVLGSQEIKVEEIILDPPLAGSICQNRQSASMQPQQHFDIRTVLVKEECSLVLNESQATQGSRICWNVEPVSVVNTSSPVMNSGETRDGHVIPEFSTNQCIFYPVKEEEREVLVGAAQTNNEDLSTGSSSETQQTEHQATDGGRHSAPDYQKKKVRHLLSDTQESDFADGQVETDTEWQHTPDVQEFLLQSSDEEDTGGFELADPQLDSEAEVMSYFNKNHTNSTQRSDETSQNFPDSEVHSQAHKEGERTRRPIDYFSKYFGWDTWTEIANCTNQLSHMSNPVTARAVAQFVGIHIAMGTLKFPSLRLYWEDLTKVPLIAEAMPLSRFLELSRMLKLASPEKDPLDRKVQQRTHDSDLNHSKKLSSKQTDISPSSDDQRQGHTPNDFNSSKTQTDPLWKVQPLLCRFIAGCQSLRRDGEYAVDQYPLPLTGKMHNKKLSLHCTTLVGFSGLLLHVDLKLGPSGKEDAVEKMVPKGSTVFLCKQELSTPAMLERLLVAGVHGAGRVGGARGQIGDEFVSSDGKLMLRRSHCGFILSTAGNGQRNMASLIDNFEKAQMSTHLNRDLLKLYSIPLTASAPTCWPQAVLWYLTDIALVNSWLLYRQDHLAASAPLSFMAFRLEVSKDFILSSDSDTQDSVPPQPPLRESPCST